MEQLALFSNLPEFISLVENVLLIYIPGWILASIFFYRTSSAISPIIKNVLIVIISIVLLRFSQGIGQLFTYGIPQAKGIFSSKLFLIICSLLLALLTGWIITSLYAHNKAFHTWIERLLSSQHDVSQTDLLHNGKTITITTRQGRSWTGEFLGFYEQEQLRGIRMQCGSQMVLLESEQIESIHISHSKTDHAADVPDRQIPKNADDPVSETPAD